MPSLYFPVMLTLLTASALAASAQVERLWLTHQSNDPSKIVINWETTEPGDSVVYYGLTTNLGWVVSKQENVTLHHVEVHLPEKDTTYHYSVRSGSQVSANFTFKGYPTRELRVAVVANWQGRPKLDSLMREDVHLLMTGGDNIDGIHKLCGAGNAGCTKPYSQLIDAYPKLFQSTPFMPALGNHDKEIRPRGSQPPDEPVYDVEATAFRKFFALPDDGWKWSFVVPEFDVRFAALDLNHISDQGTTWQSCHDFHQGSPQFEWYRSLMETSREGFVITLHNEKSSHIRNREGASWHRMFRRGTLSITGFGHFAERAELDGFTYYNTSLSGRGTPYPDPKSVFLKNDHTYILMTFRKEEGDLTVDIKNLDGGLLDRKVYHRRSL